MSDIQAKIAELEAEMVRSTKENRAATRHCAQFFQPARFSPDPSFGFGTPGPDAKEQGD
jgi:hypothetical protein